MSKKIEVEQTPGKEIPTKILAESIRDIAEGVRKMRSSGLNDRAIQVLVKDATGVPAVKIQSVIRGLSALDTLYLK